jgi:hypothetical protein
LLRQERRGGFFQQQNHRGVARSDARKCVDGAPLRWSALSRERSRNFARGKCHRSLIGIEDDRRRGAAGLSKDGDQQNGSRERMSEAKRPMEHLEKSRRNDVRELFQM